MFEAAIRTLAQLQKVDTDKLQLDSIGDKENFFQERVGIIRRVTEGCSPTY